jgi:hypothetical protein
MYVAPVFSESMMYPEQGDILPFIVMECYNIGVDLIYVK